MSRGTRWPKGTPELLRQFYAMARKARLSNPLGRACALVARHYNGAIPYTTTYQDCEPVWDAMPDLEIMRRMKRTTADRWANHWRAGGSLKALRYTAEEWNAMRRARRLEQAMFAKFGGAL